MKILWRVLKVIGYIICGVFTVNLLYALFISNIRQEDLSFIYNPSFGWHTNSELVWQIIYSIVFLLIGWGLISLSRKKLKNQARINGGP
jgi:hypothetical protein